MINLEALTLSGQTVAWALKMTKVIQEQSNILSLNEET
jgi:hypothetical protein